MGDGTSSELPRKVLDNLLEGCQVISPEGRYLYLNDAAARHGRRPKDELLGRTMTEAYPGIEDTPMFAILRRVLEERTPDRMENQFTFPDGSKAWFELRFEPVPDGVCILSVDITEQKRTDEALRRSNRALKMLSHGNQAIIREEEESSMIERLCTIIVETGGYLRAWVVLTRGGSPEPSLETVAHASRDERRAGAAEVPALLERACSSGGPTGRALRRGEIAIDRLGAEESEYASWRWMAAQHGIASCMALPLFEGERLAGALTVCAVEPDGFGDEERTLLEEMAADLSYGIAALRARAARRRAEEQLQRSQRLESIGRLAGGIAHDFNNLLTIILSCAELALGGLGEGDPLRADLEEIRRAAQSAGDLTRQLLAFSRRQVMEPRAIQLNELLRSMESMLRRLIGEDIELTMDLDRDLGLVTADAGQIEQVLLNLVVNARDAMPDGGRLVIGTANVELGEGDPPEGRRSEPGSHVRLSVSDTGCGIDPPTLARIFEPFFTTKEAGKGTGLGLSTVYGIVRQSGGEVRVESEPERGAVFRILLPRRDSPEETAARAVRVSPHTLGSETILVVEDSSSVREVTRRILAGAGYEVLTVTSSEKALLIAERHRGPIHLLLTDVVMPRMSGPELVRRFSAIRPEAAVLYMSGYTDDAIVHHGVLEPGVSFLAKPFTGADLTRKVREVLDQDRG